MSLTDERFTPENRQRLSGPGLRAFLNLADEWGLCEDQQIRILGMPLASTYSLWAKRAREGRDLTLSVDVLMRISAVLGIYGDIQILEGTGQGALEWLLMPYDAAPFAARTPMALVTSGSLDDLMSVRDFLGAATQGNPVEPNAADREFVPYQSADIVWA